DGAPGARLGPASSHARGRGGALVLQPHALGSHPGVSVLRAGVLAREPLARLRNGAWRQPGPAPPPRPDEVGVLPGELLRARGDDRRPALLAGRALGPGRARPLFRATAPG